MNCVECNGIIREVTGTYDFNCKTLGKVHVPHITFNECQSCGERLLSFDSSVAMLQFVKEREQEEINKLPAGDLMTAGEAAEILGVTKQAFSKNPKIKRGFIYSVTKGNRKLYFKKSVLLFKEQGDGRFSLIRANKASGIEYVFVTIPIPGPGYSQCSMSSDDELSIAYSE